MPSSKIGSILKKIETNLGKSRRLYLISVVNNCLHIYAPTYLCSSARYHPVHNNCIDFALSACEFLGVPMIDGFHTDLNNWIKDQ